LEHVLTRENVRVTHPDLNDTGLSEQLREELAVYRALKPYLSRCLTMNHDLNNPLTGILGYTEFMLMDQETLTEEQRLNLEQIARCAEQMRLVVEGLSNEKIGLTGKLDLASVIEYYKTDQRDQIK